MQIFPLSALFYKLKHSFHTQTLNTPCRAAIPRTLPNRAASTFLPLSPSLPLSPPSYTNTNSLPESPALPPFFTPVPLSVPLNNSSTTYSAYQQLPTVIPSILPSALSFNFIPQLSLYITFTSLTSHINHILPRLPLIPSALPCPPSLPPLLRHTLPTAVPNDGDHSPNPTTVPYSPLDPSPCDNFSFTHSSD